MTLDKPPIHQTKHHFHGTPPISGDESSRRESTIMKDVVSTLPVLKNVFSRFFAQSILIGSFFGCSRCLDLVWVQPEFLQVFQIAMGRRKATKVCFWLLMRQQDSEPIWLWNNTCRSQWRAVKRQDGVERLVLRSLRQLVFDWYISIYIDKFWRCFSFGPQKLGEDFPMFFFVANWGGSEVLDKSSCIPQQVRCWVLRQRRVTKLFWTSEKMKIFGAL